MAEHLAGTGTVKWIPIRLSSMGRNLCRLEKYSNRILRHRLMVRMTRLGSHLSYLDIPHDKLDECDVICAFFCSDVVANIHTTKPIIYFTDATFPAMLDYHPDFTGLWKFNRKQGIELERKAIANASATVFSSDWARQSAIHDLETDPARLHVVEFGPNIDTSDIDGSIRGYDASSEELNLLFIGVNWQRKGGDKAVEACRWLNSNGIRTRLTIIGIPEPPQLADGLPYIVNLGFLDKNIHDDYAKLTEALKKAHMLILPTLNECSAIAFCEAAAYGLPVLTHDTGGIPNYVINGYNGFRLGLDSTGEDFGRKIKGIIDNSTLSGMSANALKLYREKLNYGIWTQKVAAIIHSILRHGS